MRYYLTQSGIVNDLELYTDCLSRRLCTCPTLFSIVCRSSAVHCRLVLLIIAPQTSRLASRYNVKSIEILSSAWRSRS